MIVTTSSSFVPGTPPRDWPLTSLVVPFMRQPARTPGPQPVTGPMTFSRVTSYLRVAVPTPARR